MEFITVEQFKEQPKEVQKVFLDWWKPSIGDLYCNEILVNFEGDKIQKLQVVRNVTDIDYIKQSSAFLCALFTEGQLRRFIEDKTGYKKLDITASNLEDGYYIELLDEKYYIQKAYHCLDGDLLQAYWKVACMIAREEVDG